VDVTTGLTHETDGSDVALTGLAGVNSKSTQASDSPRRRVSSLGYRMTPFQGYKAGGLNRMKHRKLRIAWSAAWGVVAVLLCVLWVRSYTRLYWCCGFPQDDSVRQLQVADGNVLFFVRPGVAEWGAGSLPIKYAREVNGRPVVKPIIGWQTRNGDTHVEIYTVIRVAMMPVWVAPLAVVLLAALAWLPRRFSLRTLLIGTMLVAIVLGLIVWTSRAG
jgi:hypothetical protein